MSRLFIILMLGLVAAAALAEEQTVIVQRGDTLGQIAERHGVSAIELQLHNDLANANRIAVGQVLKLPPKPGTPRRYVVQSGDTLSDIARDHGVKTQTLIEFNELKEPNRLRVGQEILIPPGGGSGVVVTPARLPDPLRRELDRIRVRRGWTHIVVHHSGTERGNVRDMDHYHRRHRRMENGLGYHFVIGNGNGMRDGEIAIGQRWLSQIDGGHLASAEQNKYSIGICLVGNFDNQRPTAKQMESLTLLTRYLQQRSRISTRNVTTHTRINVRPTRCPGQLFPYDSFVRGL
jgi:LysM repeat protein